MDLRSGELRKSGALVHLRPQPFRVLALLATRPGELVSREEIQREIWGEDTFVDYEQGLRASIKKIRAALGDRSESPRYIETLSRRGYRFIAPVETVQASGITPSDADMATAAAGPSLPSPVKRSALKSRWLFTGGVLLVMVLVLMGLNLGGLRRRPLDAASARTAMPVTKIRSLVVLPLENVSGDRSQDFFSAGLTDELTADLAEVRSLRVVSQTSAMVYRDTRTPLSQIAKALHVDAVVEGTAMRAGGRVRITAQLIDTHQGKSLWAGSFEGQATNVLQLEDDVAGQISSYVTASISSPKAPSLLPHPAQPISIEAQDAYWRGRYLIDRREAQGNRQGEGNESAIEDFREAIKIDPHYARAYAGLAQALMSESALGLARANDAMREARVAARHALELDPNLSEAYCALGMIQGTDYEWKEAVKSLQRSLELNPNNSLAEIILSSVLTAEGRTQEAVADALRAVQLDPLSFFANRNLGSILYFAGRYDEALTQFEQARALENNIPVIDNWISWIYGTRKQYDLAEKYNEKVLSANGTPPVKLAQYHAAYRREGWKGYWRAQLRDALSWARSNQNNGCVGYYVGMVELQMGKKAAALDGLRRAVNQHCVWAVWLKADPRLASLHSDPRFEALLAYMNLKPVTVATN